MPISLGLVSDWRRSIQFQSEGRMDDKTPVGRHQGVEYFNGDLFREVNRSS